MEAGRRSSGAKRVRWASRPIFHEEGEGTATLSDTPKGMKGPLGYARLAIGNLNGTGRPVTPVMYNNNSRLGARVKSCDAWTSDALNRYFHALAT